MGTQAGVRGSDKFVLVMSEQYFEREFCLKELRWAQQYNKEVRIRVRIIRIRARMIQRKVQIIRIRGLKLRKRGPRSR